MTSSASSRTSSGRTSEERATRCADPATHTIMRQPCWGPLHPREIAARLPPCPVLTTLAPPPPVPPPPASQISDLQFLLEMFSRWQTRVFPHGQFDDFIQSLEKMSSQSIVKVGHEREHTRSYSSQSIVKVG